MSGLDSDLFCTSNWSLHQQRPQRSMPKSRKPGDRGFSSLWGLRILGRFLKWEIPETIGFNTEIFGHPWRLDDLWVPPILHRLSPLSINRKTIINIFTNHYYITVNRRAYVGILGNPHTGELVLPFLHLGCPRLTVLARNTLVFVILGFDGMGCQTGAVCHQNMDVATKMWMQEW